MSLCMWVYGVCEHVYGHPCPWVSVPVGIRAHGCWRRPEGALSVFLHHFQPIPQRRDPSDLVFSQRGWTLASRAVSIPLEARVPVCVGCLASYVGSSVQCSSSWAHPFLVTALYSSLSVAVIKHHGHGNLENKVRLSLGRVGAHGSKAGSCNSSRYSRWCSRDSSRDPAAVSELPSWSTAESESEGVRIVTLKALLQWQTCSSDWTRPTSPQTLPATGTKCQEGWDYDI